MKDKLLGYWDALRTTYWFVPSLMTAGAVLLAMLMVHIDETVLTGEQFQGISWLYTGSPAGARDLLTTVAGSMITVAGVTFSIIIVALTLASTQFGPRLLYNFMRDAGNQIVLGTFIATFLYSLLVLRRVPGVGEEAFIPHLSITVAVLLAVASIGLLIFFVHHAAHSIHLLTVIDRVSDHLSQKVETLFPTMLGEGADEDQAAIFERVEAQTRHQQPHMVRAQKDGYLNKIDEDALLGCATANDLLVRLTHRPGEFVVKGQPLASVWPREGVGESDATTLQEAFVIGSHRTPNQDILFLVDELVEVAVRALSSGVNDPFTAIACSDLLGAALCRVAPREIPSPFRRDEEGALRLIANPISFDEFMASSLNMIRRYGCGQVEVNRHLLLALARVARCTDDAARLATIQEHAARIVQANRGTLPEWDFAEIEEAHRQVQQSALAPATMTAPPN